MHNTHLCRSTRPLAAAAAVAAALAAHATPAMAQPATAVLLHGAALSGRPDLGVLLQVRGPTVNHAGGVAALIATESGLGTGASHLWGRVPAAGGGWTTLLRSRQALVTFDQAGFEHRFGMDDLGRFVYSADLVNDLGVGFRDSVWMEDSPLAVQGLAVTAFQGPLYWRFASRPGVTGDGTPYWLGGLAATDGSGAVAWTQSRALFYGATAQPLLHYGTTIPTLGDLSAFGTVGPAFDFSADGSQYIAHVRLQAPETSDEAIVLTGEALLAGSGRVREGQPVGATGKIQGERWRSFGPVAVNSGGSWAFAAQTDAEPHQDSVLVTPLGIVHREGMTIDGVTLQGAARDLAMNEQGDVAAVWGTGDGSTAVLLLNGRALLHTADTGPMVDLDDDGVADQGTRVEFIRSPDGLALSDRRPDGKVEVYFLGRLEGHGGYSLLRILATKVAGCTADANGDGTVNSNDISAFLLAWLNDVSNGTLNADFDRNGTTNSNDISAFLTAWLSETGPCP